MKMKTLVILTLSTVSMLLLASCTIGQKAPEKTTTIQTPPTVSQTGVSQENAPAFSVSEKSFDFGKIKQSGGEVRHSFVIRYNGKNPLKVTGVPTSCACTTAKIDKTVLSPGDSATITVTFDPNLHAEPEGKFFKTISLLTESVIQDAPELKIWAEIDLDLGPGAYKLKAPHEDDGDEH